MVLLYFFWCHFNILFFPLSHYGIMECLSYNMTKMTSRETIIALTDAMRPLGDIRFKAMFGEWGVYLNESFVAIIGDDTLFIKVKGIPDDTVNALVLERREPYPGAKNYAVVDPARLEDVAYLEELRAALLAAKLFTA
jgi:TfoX/Sxy family transcriptional regulator of competence genes